MKQITFDVILEETILRIKKTFEVKTKEYVLTDDVLKAFKTKDTLFEPYGNRKSVLWGYLLKHLNSLNDMCHQIPDELNMKFADTFDEKIIDAINYLILLRALVREK